MTPQERVANAMLDQNMQATRLGIPQQMGAFANSLGMIPTAEQEALQEPLIAPETYGMGSALRKAAGVVPGMLGMTVFHGSPFNVGKFSMEKAGQHGGTSFGLGLNFSKDINHAKAYKGDNGYLYSVDLPDDAVKNFAHWEKPVPSNIAQQLPAIPMGKALPFGGGAMIEKVNGQWMLKSGSSAFPMSQREMQRMFGDANTGEQAYRKLVAALGDERKASQWLNERGIKGIINNEAGVENYVVFDDALPKIMKRE